MNYTQFLLTKLAEECSEVSKAALKAQQFGLDSVNPVTLLTGQSNRDRLNEELNDLLAVLQLLNLSADLRFEADPDHQMNKKSKVIEYKRYSQKLGMVNPD